MELMKRLLKEEEGQAVIEYVVIAAMLSIVAIAMLEAVGVSVNNMWSYVNGKIE